MNAYDTELRLLSQHADRLAGTPAAQALLRRAQVITATGRLKKDLISSPANGVRALNHDAKN